MKLNNEAFRLSHIVDPLLCMGQTDFDVYFEQHCGIMDLFDDYDANRAALKRFEVDNEKLYRSPNRSRVDFADYLKQLSHNLVRDFNLQTSIDLQVNIDPVYLPVDQTIPCGLIVTKLVMNCLKDDYYRDASTQTERSRKISMEVHFDRTTS